MDSNVATLDSAECRVVLTAATSVATQLVAQLWQVPGAELGTVLGMLDALAAVVCGARLAVVGEAELVGRFPSLKRGRRLAGSPNTHRRWRLGMVPVRSPASSANASARTLSLIHI